jgi:hypothetical protein
VLAHGTGMATDGAMFAVDQNFGLSGTAPEPIGSEVIATGTMACSRFVLTGVAFLPSRSEQTTKPPNNQMVLTLHGYNL